MGAPRRREEVLDELRSILSGIDAACHPATLDHLDYRLNQVCDFDNDMINGDEEICTLLDMIFDKFDSKQQVINRLDKFMEEQLSGLTTGEDEDEQ